MFKISTDCLIKNANLSNEGIFWKSLIPFLRRTYALYAGLKWKPYKKAFSSIKTKTNPNLTVKLAERSYHLSLLSIWWDFKHLYSLTRENGMYRT